MRKDVFRNFDFVVCQTDEMKEIQKILQSAYFSRFLPYIYFYPEILFERDIDCWKKNVIFQKWRWCCHPAQFRTRYCRPPGLCAHSIHTLQKVSSGRFTTRRKKPEFRSLFADLGHFLTSDVIQWWHFFAFAPVPLIGLMKLFALGRTDSANSCKLWLAGKVAKFTEKAIIPLRILSSVGDAWRPPGHPRRLRPVLCANLDTGLLSAEDCFR